MPVSDTSKATTAGDWLKIGCSWLNPLVTGQTLSCTSPFSVNLKAFESKFFKTCCSRLESVKMERPRLGSMSTLNESCLVSASCLNGLAIASTSELN